MVKTLELTTEEKSFLGSMINLRNVKSSRNVTKIEEYREKYGCDPCDACGPSSCSDCKACAADPINLPNKKY